MGATLGVIVGALLHLSALLAGIYGLCITILDEALVGVARSFLDTAFQVVSMLDVLDLFISTTSDTRVLVLATDRSPHVPDVTVLVVLVTSTVILLLN